MFTAKETCSLTKCIFSLYWQNSLYGVGIDVKCNAALSSFVQTQSPITMVEVLSSSLVKGDNDETPAKITELLFTSDREN